MVKAEGSELSQKLGQLKMKSADGKFYKTNVADAEQLFRLNPIHSTKPFKLFGMNASPLSDY